MKSIIVFGATGFTGRRVVEALLALGLKNLVLGGRNQKALEELALASGSLEWRIADARDPDSLTKLVRGAQVVISTAGPFLELGEPVVRAALQVNAHFLDTTGEQAYMLRILERYHGAARERNLCIVNAQAFEFALGYCLAALLASSSSEIDTIDVFNQVLGFGTTRGTQKSAVLALTQDAYIRQAGRLVKRGISLRALGVQMPGSTRLEPAVPFPGGEAVHLANAYPHVRNVTTNLVVPPALATILMGVWSTRSALRLLHKAGALAPVLKRIDRGPAGPSLEERQKQRFKVLARGRGNGRISSVLATGIDPYGTTGVIAALGAKFLSAGPPLTTGVVSTDQAFGAQTFLDALSGLVRVSRHDS